MWEERDYSFYPAHQLSLRGVEQSVLGDQDGSELGGGSQQRRGGRRGRSRGPMLAKR